MENLEFYKTLFEDSPAAMMLADDHGRYIDVNKGSEILLGAKREDIIGKKISDFVAPIRVKETANKWNKFKSESQQDGYFVVSRPNGTDRIIYYRAKMNILPGVHLSVAFDVTGSELSPEKW